MPDQNPTYAEEQLAALSSVEQAKRPTILEEAQRLVYGDRESSYGHPRRNMAAAAKLISAYVEIRAQEADPSVQFGLLPGDAAVIMILLKLARYATGEGSRDTVVDIAGYAEVLARCEGLDP